MPRKPTSIYSGKLATPMPPYAAQGFFGSQRDEKRVKEWRERFHLLLAHYKLADKKGSDLWPELAIRLMLDHVTGFREAPQRRVGRPRTRESEDARNLRADLLRRVEEAQTRNQALSDKQACKDVLKLLRRNEPGHPWVNRALSTLRCSDLPLARKDRSQRRNMLAFYLAANAKDGSPPFNLELPSLFGLATLGRDKTLTLKSLAKPTDLLEPPALPKNWAFISKQK